MRILPLFTLGLACLAVSCSSPATSPQSDQAQPRSDRTELEQKGRRLRILTYNIHHAEGTDGQLALDRIAKIIRSAEPDLVALQEVDDNTTRTGSVNQTAELARLTGMHGKFGQAMLYRGGGYGQAILSKWPLQSTTVYSLPQQSGREPRIALVAEIKAGDKGPLLRFASTHLDHEIETIRVGQAERLNLTLATNQISTILAGDFNAGPESATMKIFSAEWLESAASNPAPTIPAGNPQKRIDYILLRPTPSWRVIETRVIEESVASDHRPVLAVVELSVPK